MGSYSGPMYGPFGEHTPDESVRWCRNNHNPSEKAPIEKPLIESRKPKEGKTDTCGGCFREFDGPNSASDLKNHIENYPCQHYATR